MNAAAPKKFPLAATLVTLLCAALLCDLGSWQLHRLAWKTQLISQLNIEYAKDASRVILGSSDLKGDFTFKRGTFKGVYLYDKDLLVGPRYNGEFPGFHLITPLRLDKNVYVLVDRGWVPQDWTVSLDAHPREEVSVTGLLRQPDAANFYLPPSDPAKNKWTNVDPAQIAAAKRLENVSSYVLYEEGDATRADYPLPQSKKPELPNNHLQYAFFWFSMAGVLLIVYYFRFLRKKA